MPYPVVETPARPHRNPHGLGNPATDLAVVAKPRCGCECGAFGCVSLATGRDVTPGPEYASVDHTDAAIAAEASSPVRPVYPVVEWFGGVDSW